MKYKVITAIDSQDLEDKLNQYPEYTVYSTTIHPYSFLYVSILIKEKF